jgi:arylsulfatase A-like enzyme
MTPVFLLAVGCSPPAPAPSGGGVAAPTREPAPAARTDGDAPARRRGPPNVLLVVLDDVGVDKVAAYGESKDAPPTPTLSGLAREGVLFRNAWAHPYCSPTRAAIQTGRYAGRFGLGYVVFPERDGPELPPSAVTLPEMLERAPTRWDSSLVGKWHLGSSQSGPAATHPGRQGYAWYASTLDNLHGPRGYWSWTRNENGTLREETRYATTVVADDAIARTRAMAEPWLLTLAFHAAHAPWHDPPPELGGTLGPNAGPAERYDAMLRAADAELGRVLSSMDPAVRARTMVFVIGDNGTADPAVRPPRDPAQAKGTVYELGVNVPLIVAGPLVTRPGESDALVHAVDLFPTIADLANVELTTLPDPVDGRSLLPALADPTAAIHPTILTETFQPNGAPRPVARARAIRGPRYKLVAAERQGQPPVEQLFDLKGREDDGPDLLATGTLSEDARQALQALRAELARQLPDDGAGEGDGAPPREGKAKAGGPPGKARKHEGR